MNETQYLRLISQTPEFEEYYSTLTENVRNKYEYVFNILATQYVVSEKFVKKIDNSAFYEVRVSLGNNEYQTLFIAIDNDSFMECKRILLLNSFLKKDNKQYKREIKMAEQILKRYE